MFTDCNLTRILAIINTEETSLKAAKLYLINIRFMFCQKSKRRWVCLGMNLQQLKLMYYEIYINQVSNCLSSFRFDKPLVRKTGKVIFSTEIFVDGASEEILSLNY